MTPPQGFRVEDLEDPERALALLARWDELDPGALETVARHPRHGPRLASLRNAERWLRGQRATAADPCPAAEELYDYGRGPGYAPLGPARRSRIATHVRACADCRELVQTLEAPPPLPLDLTHAEARIEPPLRTPALDPFEEPAPSMRVEELRAGPRPLGRARPRGLRRLVPFLAAAGVLAAAGIWVTRWAEESRARGPAGGPLLRGRSAEVLLWPRGDVLASGARLAELWPALAHRTVFELAPRADATAWRVELRSGGDAFDAGALVATLTGPEPLLVHEAALAPGRYTWSAWVTLHGLETALGSRDFVAVEDAELDERLALLEGVADPSERAERALVLLDDSGLRADARALARVLPEGPLKDRWLAPVPAR
jgi:hypothetical protein